ncbi:hypothetical protein BDV11DRAFT_206173 [Aspergillus similis]
MQYFLSHPEYVSGTYLDYALISWLVALQSCLIALLAMTMHHKYGIKLAVVTQAQHTARAHYNLHNYQRAVRPAGTPSVHYYLCSHQSRYPDLDTAARFGCSKTRLTGRQTQAARPAIGFRVGRRYKVWLFLTWSFFSIMGIGLSTAQGSIVMAVMNIRQIVGWPLVGYNSNVVRRINIATAATFVSRVLFLLLWVCSRSYASSLYFAFFGGLGGDRPYLNTQLFNGSMYIGAALSVAFLRVWKARRVEK